MSTHKEVEGGERKKLERKAKFPFLPKIKKKILKKRSKKKNKLKVS
jgi:hypothetical protein